MLELIKDFVNQYGSSVALIASFVTIGSVFALIPRLYNLFYKELIANRKLWRKHEVERILYDQLSKNEENDVNVLDIIKSKYYIPIKVQEINPDEDKSEDSSNLDIIDYLLTRHFNKKSPIGKGKRFFILGGSGMGKSTFSAALVYFYLQKYNKRNVPFNIEMLTLGNDISKKLKEIQNPQKTILILDGLDENINAVNDKKQFTHELEILTNDFKYVILTCRTQFFESKDEELEDIGIPQFSIKRKMSYKTFYISPFNDEDIKTYLGHKYSILSPEYSLALSIVEKSKSLMSRPLVLFYVDDILDLAKQKTLSAFEIYKKIIDNWFNRECDILGINSKEARKTTINTLYDLSKKISRYIYCEWEKTGNFTLSVDKYNKFIEEQNNYSNVRFSFKERSLLNRDNVGFVKFSHKSFLEFFLAIDAIENPGTCYNVEGLEMANNFYEEIYSLYFDNKHFDNINYKHIHNTKFDFKTIEDLLISSYEEINSSEDFNICKNNYCKAIKFLWDELTLNGIKTTLDYFKVNQSQLANNLQDTLSDYQYILDCLQLSININENLNQLIDSIQKGFKDVNEINEYGWLKYYAKQVNAINDKLKALNDKTLSKSMFGNTKNNTIIPLRKKYINTRKNDMLFTNNYVYLNCSFSSNVDICNFVIYLIKEIPGINFVGLLKNSNDIIELSKFILYISENIKKSDIKLGNNDIVIFSYIENISFKYIINYETLNNDITGVLDILKGMLETLNFNTNYEQKND